MTREEARKAAEVMLAYANGAEIECKLVLFGYWDANIDPTFDWSVCEYRVKPKSEKFDPKTLQPFDKVLVRDKVIEDWACNLFSHITNEYEFPFACIHHWYKMVIPYNDDTKHLVGTTEEAPEFYRYWEE